MNNRFELKPCNSCPNKYCVEATGEVCPFDKPYLEENMNDNVQHFLTDNSFGQYGNIFLTPIRIPEELLSKLTDILKKSNQIDKYFFPKLENPIDQRILGAHLFNMSLERKDFIIGNTVFKLLNFGDSVIIEFLDDRFNEGYNTINVIESVEANDVDSTSTFGKYIFLTTKEVKFENYKVRHVGQPTPHKITVPAKSYASNIDPGWCERPAVVMEWTHIKEYETTVRNNWETPGNFIHGLANFFSECEKVVNKNSEIIKSKTFDHGME